MIGGPVNTGLRRRARPAEGCRVVDLRLFLGQACGWRSPIVPIEVGSEAAALEAAARLQRSGFLVPAIRPPTVPEGTSRLRVVVTAGHEEEEVAELARALSESGVLRLRDTHARGEGEY